MVNRLATEPKLGPKTLLKWSVHNFAAYLDLIIWTIDRKAIPSEVDEGLRLRYVALAHRWREGPCESSVILTELGVAIAIRVSLSILDPEEHQRHVGTFELTVGVGKIGHRFGLSGQTIETLRRCRQGL